MKKTLLMAGLALALALTGCGNTEKQEVKQEAKEEVKNEISEKEAASKAKEEELKKKEEEPKTAEGDVIVLGEPLSVGDYVVTVQELSIVNNHEGKPALKIVYDWENNSDKSIMASFSVNFKGYQNGVETDDVFMAEGVDLGIGQKDAKPGAKIQGVETMVGISDMSLPLELELDELISFTSTPKTMTIDLNTL